MFRAKAKSFGRELASNPIASAFAISLLVHIVGIAGLELGERAGLWERSLLSKSKDPVPEKQAASPEEKAQEQLRQALQQIPEAQLVFVEVDPAQAVQQPPKTTKYYSSQSTVASNPNPDEKEEVKVDGEQEKIAKTFDVLRPAQPLQPTPPEPQTQTKTEPKPGEEPQRPVEEDTKPKREQQPGETLLARAAPRPKTPPPAPEQRRRPTTVAEAKAQKGIIEGRKTRQEGGVRRHSLGTNLDVQATPFGTYDHAFIMAVQARWFSLLDERDFVGGEAGRVVVEFRLNHDGRITALRVVESEVSEVLSWFCQRAVLDPAPYRPFPSDLRRMLNHDYREVRFTFYYNQ